MTLPSPKSKHQAPLDLDELHLSTAHNGYLVETPEDSPNGLFVFPTFESLTNWLFMNLVKPETYAQPH